MRRPGFAGGRDTGASGARGFGGRAVAGAEGGFWGVLWGVGGVYVVLILGLLWADATYTSPRHLVRALGSAEIRHAVWLSLLTCSLATLASLWIGTPLAYALARGRFRGQGLIEVLLDIPIVLPPLVIGLSLLILFQTAAGRWIERWVSVTYAVPGVVLAQFTVACAFATRTLRVTFEQLGVRQEQVALTLGCTRWEAFWRVVLPQARRGMVTAATIAWARSLGEFGPILVFAGATRMRTEVMSTSVFLELSVGNLEAAVAVSLLMVGAAAGVLLLIRAGGAGNGTWGRLG
jgi:molybdate transport system permease protein